MEGINMSEIIFEKLKSCPRVINGTLKKPIPHCKLRGRQMISEDIDINECCEWSYINKLNKNNGLVKKHYYCVLTVNGSDKR